MTVRDWVRSQKIALQELGIRHLRTVIGPSIGGMQALQWAVEYPEWVDRVVAMGTTQLNALGLGLNHLQREVIRLDPEWRGGDYYDGPGPRAGLAQARGAGDVHVQVAGAVSRAPWTQGRPQGNRTVGVRGGRFDIAGYLDYQGKLFWQRFDANAYLTITRAMDLWDPQRDWQGKAWERVRAKVLLFGISSDVLFPDSDVRAFAEELREAGVDCSYESVESPRMGTTRFWRSRINWWDCCGNLLRSPARQPWRR